MSRTVEIHSSIRLVVTRFEGGIDYEDLLRWFDEAPLEEGFSREFDGAVDLRQATFKQARSEKIQLLVSYMIEKNFTEGKWAVLVSQPMATAIALLYGKKASAKHPLKVVSTPEAVADFLGRHLDEIGAAMSTLAGDTR